MTAEALFEVNRELPEVNRELFAEIRDSIKADPFAHNQSLWEAVEPAAVCGTTRCTAGWAIWLNDPDPLTSLDDKIEALGLDSAADAGQDLLGLTEDEREYLFYQSNHNAKAMIEHYAEHGREGWEFPE